MLPLPDDDLDDPEAVIDDPAAWPAIITELLGKQAYVDAIELVGRQQSATV